MLTTAAAPAKGENFFVTMRACTFASLGLLGVLTVLQPAWPWLPAIAAATPLLYYHLGYLSPRAKKGLSQTAIDSVYYFGFLITIAALGVSALTLTLSKGGHSLDQIAIQFGLGLLATGYAVFARMHLTSITALVDETSPEAVLDRYVSRSTELVTNLELASSQFANLANNLLSKTEESNQRMREQAEKEMLSVAKIFNDQMSSTLASAKEGLMQIRGMVSETAFIEEREQLMKSIKQTIETVGRVNQCLGGFADQASAASSLTLEMSTNTGKLNLAIGALRSDIGRLAGPESQLSQSVASFEDAHVRLVTLTTGLSEIAEELSAIKQEVGGTAPALGKIKTHAAKTAAQLEGITLASESLSKATDNLQRSASATELLADNLTKTAESLPALNAQVTQAQDTLGGFCKVIGAVEQQLDGLPRPAKAAISSTNELQAAVTDLRRAIAGAGDDLVPLLKQVQTQEHALQSASTLAQRTATLQTTSEAVESCLRKLVSTVETLQSELGKTTCTLQDAIRSATSSLEGDVKRSGELTTVFGDRMASAARTLADRIREPVSL